MANNDPVNPLRFEVGDTVYFFGKKMGSRFQDHLEVMKGEVAELFVNEYLIRALPPNYGSTHKKDSELFAKKADADAALPAADAADQARIAQWMAQYAAANPGANGNPAAPRRPRSRRRHSTRRRLNRRRASNRRH